GLPVPLLRRQERLEPAAPDARLPAWRLPEELERPGRQSLAGRAAGAPSVPGRGLSPGHAADLVEHLRQHVCSGKVAPAALGGTAALTLSEQRKESHASNLFLPHRH